MSYILSILKKNKCFLCFYYVKIKFFVKKLLVTVPCLAKIHFCNTIARSANGNSVAFCYALHFATQNALATPITFGINLLIKNVFFPFF